MFEGEDPYQNSGSSAIPLHLHERNNETVGSNVTWESAHTSLMNPYSRVPVSSSQSRGSRFRTGGGRGPKLSGISEGEDESIVEDGFFQPSSEGAPLHYQPSEASTRSSLNNNRFRGTSRGGGASVISESSASYYSQQQQQRRPNRHARHLNSAVRNSGNDSVMSSVATAFNSSSVLSSINSSQQHMFDNQRLISHNPKAATQEVNVSMYQDAIPNADETTPLPNDYYDDDSYAQFRRKNASDATFTTATGGNSSNQDADIEMLSISPIDTYKSPFSSRRRLYSLVSVLAAFSLAVVGLKLSVDSLSTTASLPPQTSYTASSHASDFLPGYQFGGGLGGLTAGQERDRRMNLAYSQYGIQLSQQQQSDSSSLLRPNGRDHLAGGRNFANTASYNLQGPSDPFHGYGPLQFNAEYDSAPHQGSIQARLSSTPLTSYIPPPNNHEDGAMSSASFTKSMITLDPMFHGSMMELAVLPYNPKSERPVVWDVPLSGGESLQTIFGSCLHLVQCSRDYSSNHHTSDSSAQRKLMELVTRDDVKAVIEQSNTVKMNKQDESYEPQKPLHTQTEEDPAVMTEFHRTSTYINVDCSTPEGVDRGIAHDLAKSDLVDIYYSRDPYNIARLFAPPNEVYGRGFVIIRNPIRRAVATYKRLQIKRPDIVGDMTLEQFATSQLLQDNFLTRTLSRNEDAPLTEADVDLAKEILKRKFVVGLYDQFEHSVRRMEAFFGWKLNEGINSCQARIVQQEMNLGFNDDSETLSYDSAYAAIAEKNKFDIQLFSFAEYVFKYQERVLFGNAVDSLITM